MVRLHLLYHKFINFYQRYQGSNSCRHLLSWLYPLILKEVPNKYNVRISLPSLFLSFCVSAVFWVLKYSFINNFWWQNYLGQYYKERRPTFVKCCLWSEELAYRTFTILSFWSQKRPYLAKRVEPEEELEAGVTFDLSLCRTPTDWDQCTYHLFLHSGEQQL